MIPILTLKRGKESSVLRKHPWIFSGAIHHLPEVDEGDLVQVNDINGHFLALGHYQKTSIAVRVISFIQVEIEISWWVEQFRKALDFRKKIGIPSETTNLYRLIHGEGDGLTGLVVDIYAQVAVIQPHSIGMYRSRKVIAEALVEVFGTSISLIICKPTSDTKNKTAEVLYGESKEYATAYEWNIAYNIPILSGQKTGFFVDQRENRKKLQEFSLGKSVLNTFCYSGGFSLNSLLGGATRVISVDSSKSAIESTLQHIRQNGFDETQHPCIVADVFDFFKGNTELFDVILLDPPAFAKHLSARHQAVMAYKRLNATAMHYLKPGGILFTFSCSQVVDKNLFYGAVVASGLEAGKNIRVLERLGQPADHPVNLYHPEGEYLKGLIMEVE